MFADENDSPYAKMLAIQDKIITKPEMKYGHPTGSRELETAEETGKSL
jgi:hypothetical protein